MNKPFPKCVVCGTHGHVEGRCPVRDYNRELEARASGKITAAMLFPHNPELIARLEANARPASPAPVSPIEQQVQRLRQAWGIA